MGATLSLGGDVAHESAEQVQLGAVIEARRARLGNRAAWSAPGSVQQFATLMGTGFDPVGHVLGTTVVHLGNLSSRARCSGKWSYTGRTDLASRNGPFQGLRRRLTGARRLALSRALEECRAQHGDGILGAHMSVADLGENTLEFTVQGTAVRARSRTHLDSPFSAHTSEPEFAALLRSGWMPVSVVYAVALGSRHDDEATWRRTRKRWGASGNGEVAAYSRLVNDTRRDARDLLAGTVQERCCDGVVVDEMTLRISERECPTEEGQHDHVAESTIVGTALVAFTPGPGVGNPAPLTIMRLGLRSGGETTEEPHVRVEIAEGLTDDHGLADRLAVMQQFRHARKDPFSRDQGE